MATATESTGRWDRVGIWASTACMVHCLAAPLLFLAIPWFAEVWSHPLSHVLVGLLVLPLAGMVIRNGYRQHGKTWIIAAAALGMGLIVVGSVIPYVDGSHASATDAGTAHVHDHAHASCCPQVVESDSGTQSLSLPLASIVTMMGSLFLVLSHIGNIRACRCRLDAAGTTDPELQVAT